MNEWYISLHMPSGMEVWWSSRFRTWTALVTRAAYYKSEGQAKRVRAQLVKDYPGGDIRVRSINK